MVNSIEYMLSDQATLDGYNNGKVRPASKGAV